MTLGGAWLRCLVTASGLFPIISIGTAVAAFGQVFFLNSSSKLATTWFGDKEVIRFASYCHREGWLQHLAA